MLKRIHPVTVTGSRPLMGHCVYESVVLLPLKLCVKFEWGLSLNTAKISKEV